MVGIQVGNEQEERKGDWTELGVKSIGGWCNKVKDRGWLASKLGASKKKEKRKKKEDSRT